MTTGNDSFALERRLGRVLLIGGRASTALLAAGLLVFFAAPASGAAAWLLSAGLLMLMATPMARVVAALLGYVARRDWLFAGLTFIVLAVLIAGVVIAIREQ